MTSPELSASAYWMQESFSTLRNGSAEVTHDDPSSYRVLVVVASENVSRPLVGWVDESQGVFPLLGRRAAAGSSVRRGMVVGEAGSLGSS